MRIGDNATVQHENDDLHRLVAREAFFDYFRRRAEAIVRKDIPLPDRLILFSGCLDALATHWHATADRAEVPGALKGDERLRRFLLRHGRHPAFERVSAPLLRNATGKEVASFPFSSYRAGALNNVVDWNSDPTFDELVDIDASGYLQCRWSYAGILYVDFRCAWVHTFAPRNEDIRVTEPDGFDRTEPYYRFVLHAAAPPTFILIVPYVFLSTVLQNAIQSFEEEAGVRDIWPFSR